MMVVEVEKEGDVVKVLNFPLEKCNTSTFFPLKKCGGHTLFQRKKCDYTKTENKSGCSLSS
jgi:hypothetical protein